MKQEANQKKLANCVSKICQANNELNKIIISKGKSGNQILQYDKKTSSKLKKMIDLSRDRFKLIRVGNSIQSIINKSSDVSKVSSQILNSPVFNNLNIIDKTKKILKKNFSSDYNTKSLDDQINLLQKVHSAQNINTKNVTTKEIFPSDYYKEENIENFKRIIDEKIQKEQEELNSKIKKYLNQANDLYSQYDKKKNELDTNNKEEIHNLNYIFDQEKRAIPFPMLKSEFISYKKKETEPKKLTRNHSEIEILSNKNIANIYSCVQNLSSNSKNSQRYSKANNLAKIYENIYGLNSILNSAGGIYENTGKLLINQAIKNFSLEENIYLMRKKLDKLINTNLPTPEEYEVLFEKKFNQKNKKKIINQRIKNKNQKLLELNTDTISSSEFNDKTSEEKEISSEEEEKVKKEKEKEELLERRKQVKEEVKNFIENELRGMKSQNINNDSKNVNINDSIVKTPAGDIYLETKNLKSLLNRRNVHLFNDQYSLRDKFVNDLNVKFNELIQKKKISSDKENEFLNKFYKFNLQKQQLQNQIENEQYQAYLKEQFLNSAQNKILQGLENEKIINECSENSEKNSENTSKIC